jgi:hypothetical protein
MWPFKRKAKPLDSRTTYALIHGQYVAAFYANDHATLRTLKERYYGQESALDSLMEFFTPEGAQADADMTYNIRKAKEQRSAPGP